MFGFDLLSCNQQKTKWFQSVLTLFVTVTQLTSICFGLVGFWSKTPFLSLSLSLLMHSAFYSSCSVLICQNVIGQYLFPLQKSAKVVKFEGRRRSVTKWNSLFCDVSVKRSHEDNLLSLQKILQLGYHICSLCSVFIITIEINAAKGSLKIRNCNFVTF